ncbi:hypothetical protein EsH8_XI_000019 [Colletotrichum jinshuiense]
MLEATLASFNSLADPDQDQRKSDAVASLWKELRREFENSPPPPPSAAAAKDFSSFATFVLRRVNRSLLSIALDQELAGDIDQLDKLVPRENIYRLQANLDRYSISRSVFLFLFSYQVAASRAAQDNLKLLHSRKPQIDIIALNQAFEQTASSTTTRGKAVSQARKSLDRFKEAILALDSNAWQTQKRSNKSAPSNGTSDDPREEHPGPDNNSHSHCPANHMNDKVEEDGGPSGSVSDSNNDDGDPPASVGNSNDEDGVRPSSRKSVNIKLPLNRISPDGPVHPGESEHQDDFTGVWDNLPVSPGASDLEYEESIDDLGDTHNIGSIHTPAFVRNLSTILEESTTHVPRSTAPPPLPSSPDDNRRTSNSNGKATPGRRSPSVSIPTPLPHIAGILDNTKVTVRKRKISQTADCDKDTSRKCLKPNKPLLPPASGDRSFHYWPSAAANDTPSPEQPRLQDGAVNSSFSDTADLFGSPKDFGLSSSLGPPPLVLSFGLSRSSVASSAAFPLPDQSAMTPPESTIVEVSDMGHAEPTDGTTWLRGAEIVHCLSMMTESSGEPSWLLVDPLVTEGKAELGQSTFKALLHSDNYLLPLLVVENHWTLAILRRRRRGNIEVDLYDSLTSDAHNKAARQQLDDFCGRYLADSSRLLPGYAASMPCPQQRNGYDCGVHVIALSAYLVAHRTPPAIDSWLWRIIIHIMIELGKGEPDAPVLATKERMRELFRTQFLDHGELALPRVRIPAPKPASSTDTSMTESSNYLACVQEWNKRVVADTVRAAKQRLLAWTAAHQQLMRTYSVLESISAMATRTSDAVTAMVLRLEDEHAHHRQMLDRGGTRAQRDQESLRADLHRIELELKRAQSRAQKLRVYTEVWDFLAELVEGGRQALEDRLKMAAHSEEGDAD